VTLVTLGFLIMAVALANDTWGVFEVNIRNSDDM
jgi:hypothetical protein